MKKFKIRAVSITALLLVAGLLFIGCPQKVKEEPKPVYYTVSLVHEGGSLTTNPVLQGGKALKDSEITFTASPANPSTHEVDKWEVTGGQVVSGGEDGSISVKVKIKGDTTVKVTFKEKPVYYTVSLVHEGGSLTANPAIQDGKVLKNSEIIFTASPANVSIHEVDKWEVTGGQILEGGGAGSTNLKVKIITNTTVKVSFKERPSTISFVQIPQASIVGKVPDCILPYNARHWKGVFIEGRTVNLSSYYISKTEVPYWLWKEVYDWAIDNGYKITHHGREGSEGTNGAFPTEGGKNEPVTEVNWRSCIVWCNAYTQKQNNSEDECVYRRSATDPSVLKDSTDTAACDTAYFDKSRKGFRLPTEAEWEYAARLQGSNETNAEKHGDVWLTKLNSASGATKPIGFKVLSLPEEENWESLRDEHARVAVYQKWWNGNSNNYEYQTPYNLKTAEVGSKSANAMGLKDMSGNVWEFCWDWYEDNIKTGYITDPDGPDLGQARVIRGGSYSNEGYYHTLGHRETVLPVNSDKGYGFRLACRP
ncbi:hypothetical protein HMPREF9727_02533 [Treponema denticola MYR-T]|uniref:Sulfatase-modifying factor enzyme-like domain-containing protein n=1 Tax=Treponema denticola H1-T TaxID=999431 RepID=M2CK53_TREDN|nr:hypothetical protein HMPREF9727_02533 [Treponema denticola MYR-T]EMB34639.1 hypothetical protein HMPREF9725_00178 [Treponema denticola H1-T]